MRSVVEKKCETCKVKFEVTKSDSNRGRGRFCGKSCAASGTNNSSYKHGNSKRLSRTKEYNTWSGIIKRTTNPSQDNYKYYGGRGIQVSEAWRKSFQQFLDDMGKAPTKCHSIERVNNDMGYSKENCIWATASEQMSNTRYNVIIEYNGKRLTQEQWGREIGLNGTIICKRLKRGWSIEKTLSTPHMRPDLINK